MGQIVVDRGMRVMQMMRVMVTSGVLGGLAIALVMGGCAASGEGRAKDGAMRADEADYVFVYLKTGPKGGNELSPAERAEAFKGHMANINRLAGEGKLLIAGPFDKPRDKSWRGIFVLDTPSVETAREWTATDPAVAAGVFIAEMRPMRGSVALRKVGELEREMLAEQASAEKAAAEQVVRVEDKRASGGMPPNMRKYVMVTSQGGSADGAEPGPFGREWKVKGIRVVWRGRFTDGKDGVAAVRAGDGGEVLVVDAQRVEDVEISMMARGMLDGKSSEERRAVLASMDERENKGLPGWSVDGWWSTTSLERLPEAAGR